MMLLLMTMITMMTGTNGLRMYFYAASGKVRVLNEGRGKFLLHKKMNSFELCNDSEVYSRYAIRRITLWTFCFCSR